MVFSKQTVLLACLVVCLIPGTSDAERTAQGGRTFETLARQALQVFPAIETSRAEREAAESQLTSARWQRYPTPSIEASVDDDEQRTGVLSLEQPLWTGGRINAGVDAAQSRFQASVAGLSDTRTDVLLRLADGFSEVARRQAQLELAAQNIDAVRDLQEMIERRFDRRVSAQADLELAKSRLAQAQAERTEFQQALRLALAQIMELVGDRVESVATDEGTAFGMPQSMEEAHRLAQAFSPTLTRLEHQQQAARADARAERSAWWPNVSLRLEQREQRGDGILPGERSEFRALITVQSDFGPGLSTLSNVEAAVSEANAVGADLARERLAVETQISDLWFQRRSAQRRIESAERNVASAERVRASYRSQYAIGQKSWLDVMNAVREANSAAIALENARADKMRASLSIAILTGFAEDALLEETDR